MNENKDNAVYTVRKNTEISYKERLLKVKEYFQYLLGKWIIILVFGLGGSALGLVASLLNEPTYKAHLSFALIDSSGGASGLASLASSFGMSIMSGGDGAFSGDNLLEIIKSRHAVELALLTPVTYKGQKQNLVEVYVQINEMRDAWNKNKKNAELRQLSFPVGQKRETFTRTQDSVLHSISEAIRTSRTLLVERKDKKLDIVNMDYTSQDELFSKLFVEKLMEDTYQFYLDTRTSQSRTNIAMMEATADSIKRLYESSLYRSASISQFNINQAIQLAAVPKIKQETNAQLYGAVYAEVLKNLETLKLEMARDKPIVQIIDTPRLPLVREHLGKAKGMVIGGIWGGFLIVFWLLGALYFKNILKQ
jgi:hypothetical protein